MIFAERKLRGQLTAQAISACRKAERALGGDVDAIRIEGIQFAAYPAARKYRQAYLPVCRQRDSPAAFRRDHASLVSERLQFLAGSGEGLNNPVDLWIPRVGDYCNAHGAHGGRAILRGGYSLITDRLPSQRRYNQGVTKESHHCRNRLSKFIARSQVKELNRGRLP